MYGTCSVTSPYGDCTVCPNRLYEKKYAVLSRISIDAFGSDLSFLTFEEYISKRTSIKRCVVALGQNSGKEVKLGRSLSMDWVLALVEKGKLLTYVGIEAQSIDITGNYRDCWHAYKNMKEGEKISTPSEHGLNWANVHKRLIPQLIRKGLVYSRSNLVNSGLYFVVPEIVFNKFEDILGKDMPKTEAKGKDILTVHTYGLSEPVPHTQRYLVPARELRFSLATFSKRFIEGVNLPSGDTLDQVVSRLLGI